MVMYSGETNPVVIGSLRKANSVLTAPRDLLAGRITVSGDSLTTYQRWNLTWIEKDQAYKIVNVGSSLVLEVEGGSVKDGAHVIQYSDHGDQNQRWLLIQINQSEAGPPHYKIQNLHSGKVLDVEGGPDSTAADAFVNQWQYLTVTSHHWSIHP